LRFTQLATGEEELLIGCKNVERSKERMEGRGKLGGSMAGVKFTRIAEVVGEQTGVWKRMEIKDRGGQLDAAVMHSYGQNKKAARRAVD